MDLQTSFNLGSDSSLVGKALREIAEQAKRQQKGIETYAAALGMRREQALTLLVEKIQRGEFLRNLLEEAGKGRSQWIWIVPFNPDLYISFPPHYLPAKERDLETLAQAFREKYPDLTITCGHRTQSFFEHGLAIDIAW